MVDLYHPSQLEKRFGGQADSPKTFWPPTIPSLVFGEDPNHQMPEAQRQSMLKENSELTDIPVQQVVEE